MSFEFATAGRIVFGDGRLREAGQIAAGLGTRVLLVQGRGGRGAPLLPLLRERGLWTVDLCVPAEPTVELVEQGTDLARRERCDLVIATGGGSVLDAGKAVAAMLTNGGAVRDYLEVVGGGRPLGERPAPVIAIPTTAGTGSEVTRNAVLSATEERVKVSLRSPLMLPTVALVDPELTHTLPPEITASTGLDALTQCIEPFVSPLANPLTDGVAREGIRHAAASLRRAVRDPRDVEARRAMAVASLCGGLALANARLGAVHGFAAPLGGMYAIPHGVVCARLLAPVMTANIRALRGRAADSPALARYQDVARALTGRVEARAEEGAEWVARLVQDLRIPGLSEYGITDEDIEGVVQKAREASSMKGNPIELSKPELAAALGEAR